MRRLSRYHFIQEDNEWIFFCPACSAENAIDDSPFELSLVRCWDCGTDAQLINRKSTRRRKVITALHCQLIHEYYADNSMDELRKMTGLNDLSIYQLSNRLGVTKSTEYLAQFGHQLQRHENCCRYPKGYVPDNKGKKMPYNPNRARTQFKKGNLPANTLHDGAVTIRNDNRGIPQKYIRLSLANWQYLSVHTWTEVHGAVPENHVVIFKDGNSLNCDISNLDCISRSENMLRNSIHNLPEELKDTIRLVSRINRRIKKIKQDA